jgi:sialate O-acetylesterase
VRKAKIAAVLLVGLAVWQTPRASAEVKLHGMFTDHMVLQREADIPVWGTADPNETVAVSISREGAGQTTKTKADEKGRWIVSLGQLKAGQPLTLTVEGKNNKVVLKDILVGEVWLCSGQSNMEWSMNQIGANDDITKSANGQIRLFDVPKTPNKEPQTELGDVATIKNAPKDRIFAKWQDCGPDSVKHFSAVGYYFGRKLQKDLNVPVGLIHSSWGGTAAERWTSKAVMDNTPELKGLKGSDLYNGMIVPVQPFAIKGVIWYQGESNAGRAMQYFHLMNAMIKSWREDWKQEFPFLTVQLAPYDMVKGESSWPEIRETQYFTTLKMPKTAMAVITDAGEAKNIHPKFKDIVGERLALAGEAIAYGKKIEYLGPQPDKIQIEGDKAIVTFKNVGGGLTSKGGALTGFTIAGKDGKFVKADATIVENTVVVRSPDVAEPMSVRYGWANFPVVNLYNKEGLPATPFRTDTPDWIKGELK